MSDKPIDDGGPAFPEPVAISPVGDAYPAYSGMTLRDWFAGQALSGMFATGNGQTAAWIAIPENGAVYAYEFADAMIAARKP